MLPKKLRDKVLPLLKGISFRQFVLRAVENAAWEAYLDSVDWNVPDASTDAKHDWLSA